MHKKRNKQHYSYIEEYLSTNKATDPTSNQSKIPIAKLRQPALRASLKERPDPIKNKAMTMPRFPSAPSTL